MGVASVCNFAGELVCHKDVWQHQTNNRVHIQVMALNERTIEDSN